MMNASPAPQEIFLLKLGEVVLKGLNRRSFEMKLMGNIRRRTGRFCRCRNVRNRRLLRHRGGCRAALSAKSGIVRQQSTTFFTIHFNPPLFFNQ